MLIITVVTTAVVVAMSLWGRAEPSSTLRAFYQRVQPPGFWGPVAAVCGDDPRAAIQRLRSGLFNTGASSLAVFCLLVGIGSWLVDSPAPTWFPWRGPWIAGLLLVSTALGIWVHSGIRRDSNASTEAAGVR
jgi:hypothetical protein